MSGERRADSGQPRAAGSSTSGKNGFSIVVAMDTKRGIGNKGDLPWPKLKGDMRFFRELTTCPDRAAVEKRWGLKPTESADVQAWGDVSNMLKFAHPLPAAETRQRNVVLMGRKTWESLPESYRPLPARHNLVLTRQHGYSQRFPHPDGESSADFVSMTGDVGDYLAMGGANLEDPLYRAPHVFVIGGGEVFVRLLSSTYCKHLYITEIDSEFACDTFFPETPDFEPVLSSPWIEEGGIRYRFRRYDRVG